MCAIVAGYSEVAPTWVALKRYVVRVEQKVYTAFHR